MISIRELNEKDVDFLVSAKDYGFNDCWNKNMIESAFNGKRFFGFIAEEVFPVGFLTYSKNLDNEVDLEDIFVIPKFRNKGIGKLMLNKLISKNFNKIYLEVRKSNIVAVKLYSDLGFKRISERKKYYFDGEDALILVWEAKK